MKGLDLHQVQTVVQYRLPQKVDDMVQCFGRSGQDQLMVATMILLVEKKFCSKKAIGTFDGLDTKNSLP